MSSDEDSASLAKSRRSFFEITRELRRQLLVKKAEYHKAATVEDASPEKLRALEQAINGLEAQIRRRWPR